MPHSTDAWTNAHDLALIFIALAYGTDQELSTDEMDTLVDAVAHWRPQLDTDSVREVVMEALAIFMERDAEDEVQRAVLDLAQALEEDELRRALEQVVHIAEADGILLTAEQTLITELGRAWSLKELSQQLLSEATSTVDAVQRWSLLHDLVLVYVVVAHSTDAQLTDPEIEVMLQRIDHWMPQGTEREAREVIRDVLQAYAEEPGQEVLQQSVKALKDWLPPIQRILVLDDLNHIARADGTITESEREMITDLARAWQVVVRLSSNGRAPH